MVSAKTMRYLFIGEQLENHAKDFLTHHLIGWPVVDNPALLIKCGRFGKSQSLYPLGVYRLPAEYSANPFNRTLLCCSAA